MKPLTFGSLFDGIGCFSLGLRRAGFEQRWLVELEDDCRRASARNFSGVQQHADIRKCGKKNLDRVDLIVGGFPCQDLSVAGKRGGITGERSGLFHEMVRICDELRPRFLLWENVAGLLSSFSPTEAPPDPMDLRRGGNRDRLGDGAVWEVEEDSDFETVLACLGDIHFFGAVRLLDGQFFGVPQRRRRLFGLFAGVNPRDRKRMATQEPGEEQERLARLCAEILSDQAGQGRDSEARGGAGQDIAASLRSRSARSPGVNQPGRGGEDDVNLVIANDTGGSSWNDRLPTRSAADRNGTNHVVFSELGEGHQTCQNAEQAASLKPPTGGGSTKNNLVAVAFQCQGSNVGPMGTLRNGNGNEQGGVPFIAHALTSNGADASEDGTGRGVPLAVVFNPHRTLQKDGSTAEGFKEGSVTDALHGPTGNKEPLIVQAEASAVQAFQTRVSRNGRGQPSDTVPALTSCEGGTHADSKPHVFGAEMTVRRLTPTECLRLQGLPDDWLDLDPSLSDSAKYRMIGNGGVVNVLEWIGRRIMAVLAERDGV